MKMDENQNYKNKYKNSNKDNNKTKNNLIKDDKLKSLQPTLRLKKRFIKLKIISDKKFDFKTLSEKLSEEIILYIGLIDYSKSGIWILKDKFKEEEQELILKVDTKNKNKLIGALALIQKINSIDVKIETIRSSGTLKGLEGK